MLLLIGKEREGWGQWRKVRMISTRLEVEWVSQLRVLRLRLTISFESRTDYTAYFWRRYTGTG